MVRMVTELDTFSTMSKLSFEHEKYIDGNRHGAVEVATRAWLEICEAGHGSSRYVGFQATDSCVYSVDSDTGDVVAIVVFRNDVIRKQAAIQLGWTHPDWRGKGVYRNLLQFFERVLRDQGIETIETMVADDNTEMQGVSETRQLAGKIFRKDVG